MKHLRKMVSWMLIAMFIISAVGTVFSTSAFATPRVSEKLVLDTDAQGGYSGKYVMIYNPSTNPSTYRTTGSLSDQIKQYSSSTITNETETPENKRIKFEEKVSLSEAKIAINEAEKMSAQSERLESAKYEKGSTRIFSVYNTLYSEERIYVEFTLASKGEHCNVWVIKNQRNTLTDADAAAISREYDTKIHDSMKNAFGDYYDPERNDVLNILAYDIQDGYGYNGTNSFVAGYFTVVDLMPVSSGGNDAAMIHIDTYPAIYLDGDTKLQDAYSTLVHEFQHLINTSAFIKNPNVSDYDEYSMETWLNECCSIAAQEMIYPGSASDNLRYFIQGYRNYFETGSSMYDWSNNLLDYGMGYVFGQYLRLQTGGYAVFKKMINVFATDAQPNEAKAVERAVSGSLLQNMKLSEIVLASRIAMFANEVTAYNGIYGFRGTDAFDALPAMLYPYTSSASIYGGGAIIIETANGTFVPPSNASSGLEYVGIDFVDKTQTPTPTPVPTAVPAERATISISADNKKPNVGDEITVTVALENPPQGMDTIELIIPIDTEAFETVGSPEYLAPKHGSTTGTAAFRGNGSEMFFNWTDKNQQFSGSTLVKFRLKVKTSGVIKLSDESFLRDGDTMNSNEEFPMVSAPVNIDAISSSLELTAKSTYVLNRENKILDNVGKRTTLAVLLDNFKSKNIIVTDKNGGVVNDKNAFVGTGYEVHLVDANEKDLEKFTVVVRGDINGDADMNSKDISKIQKYIFGIITIKGAPWLAADVKADERINSRDIAQLQHIIMLNINA